MEVLGYISFLVMGMTLGLVGAGGSILTIPILVYVFKVPVLLSTTYSLFIVGTSAFFGLFRSKNAIAYRKAFLFALPSLIGVSITRLYIIPYLPDKIRGYPIESWLLGLLVIFMLLASYFMIRGCNLESTPQKPTLTMVLRIAFIGLFMGMIMGLLGAGGGFLIIPTLVLFLGINMKQAVSTSLFIIMINSTTGFFADRHPLDISHYMVLFFFTGISMCGMWLGTRISTNIPNHILHKGFGWFIAIVAVIILVKEFYLV